MGESLLEVLGAKVASVSLFPFVFGAFALIKFSKYFFEASSFSLTMINTSII